MNKRIKVFNPRNKWARRGRNLAYFLMSFLLYSSVYILYGIWVAIKWIFCSIVRQVRKAKKATQPVISGSIEALPDRFTRLQILMAQLENKSVQEKLDVGKLIDLTDGFSEADLIGIVNSAERIARSNPISQKNLLSAFSDWSEKNQKIKK